MFTLTREVRFGIGAGGGVAAARGDNAFAGQPPLCGLGHFFTLRLALAGQPQARSGYLVNIRDVDQVVRERAVPVMARWIADGRFGGGGRLIWELFEMLEGQWLPVSLAELSLSLSPYLSISNKAREQPMVYLSQMFEFSAAHRLANSGLSDQQNMDLFGKCANPHGHGHNYQVQVTVTGEPDDNGVILEIPAFNQLVHQAVIAKVDHRNLNVEVPEFSQLIPSVENIAAVIYGWLKPRLADHRAKLHAVTVWETPKTWCEFRE